MAAGRALGSVGLCFYLGTTIAGAMYVLGAVEVIKDSLQDVVILGEASPTRCTRASRLEERGGRAVAAAR